MRRADRGVSSTISVALLLVLVLVLSVALAMMATSLSNVLNDTSKASVTVESDQDDLNIRVVSLQEESVDYIYVKSVNTTATGGLDSSSNTYPDGPSDTAYYLYSTGDGGAGTTVTLDMSAAESQTIYVISVTDDSEKILREYDYSG